MIVCCPEKCVGCGICELVCSAVKEGGFNPVLSRIRLIRLEPRVSIAITCQLCEEPPCIEVCPKRGALSQDKETGVISVDKKKCDGCGFCSEACEFGAMPLHIDKKLVVVCDLCDGDPQCVKYCPKGALAYLTPDEVSRITRRREATELLDARGAFHRLRWQRRQSQMKLYVNMLKSKRPKIDKKAI